MALRRKKKNPSYTVRAKPKTEPVTETVSALTRGSAIRKVQRKVKGPKAAYTYSVEKNPKRKRNRSDIHKIVRDHIRAGRNQKQILDLMKRAGFKKEYLAEARKIYNSEKRFVKRMRTGRNPKVYKWLVVRTARDQAPINTFVSAGSAKIAIANAKLRARVKGISNIATTGKWVAKKVNPKSEILSTVNRVAVKVGRTAIGAVGGAIKRGAKAAKGNPKKRRTKKGKNPSYTVEARPKTKSVTQTVSALTRGGAIRKVQRRVSEPKNAYTYRVEKNPRKRKVSTRKRNTGAFDSVVQHIRDRDPHPRNYIIDTIARDISYGDHTPIQVQRELIKAGMSRKSAGALVRKAQTRGRLWEQGVGDLKERAKRKKKAKRPKSSLRKRNSPIAEQQRKEFAGHFDGYHDLYYSSSNPPKEPSKLGELKSIRTSKADFTPMKGSMWLVRDIAGKLHIGTTRQGEMFAGPVQDLGVVERIEYLERKPHLGDYQLTEYYHRMGEENGIKPHLWSDGKGGLVFKGGDYRIESRGIVN